MDLPIFRYFKYLQLAYFSQPASERCLYRAIRRSGATRIVEVGIGVAGRALRMIEAARGNSLRVRYTGIDEFEARSEDAEPGLTLKHAHQLLRPSRARIQLQPGDPFSALSRMANSLTGSDLVVISADLDVESLRKAWFYLPRMLHERSLVYLQEPNDGDTALRFVQLAHGEVNRLADASQTVRRRAA